MKRKKNTREVITTTIERNIQKDLQKTATDLTFDTQVTTNKNDLIEKAYVFWKAAQEMKKTANLETVKVIEEMERKGEEIFERIICNK